MFNIGPGEIVLISVVALLLLGPDKLPELARGMGRFFREFRKHTDDVRTMVEREFYRMDLDKDVLQDGAKKEPPSVSPVSESRFGRSLGEGSEERILPPPSFPSFPAPEGVVASRPAAVEAVPAEAPQPVGDVSSDTVTRSDLHPDAVPGRDA